MGCRVALRPSRWFIVGCEAFFSMKRKQQPEEPIVSREILEQARLAITTDRAKPAPRCAVCGAECAPNSREQLCWVCRRLKISAWGDSDHQMPAQE